LKSGSVDYILYWPSDKSCQFWYCSTNCHQIKK